MLAKLKDKVKRLKEEIVPIYFALFDKRTPLLAKVLAGLTVGYLLSPIDLIPDFIPILGLLDDLIIVPLLLSATLKLIPKNVIDDIKANKDTKQRLKQHWYYAIPIIFLYIYLIILLFQYAKSWIN